VGFQQKPAGSVQLLDSGDYLKLESSQPRRLDVFIELTVYIRSTEVGEFHHNLTQDYLVNINQITKIFQSTTPMYVPYGNCSTLGSAVVTVVDLEGQELFAKQSYRELKAMLPMK
jgi:hypothetical protein